MEYYSYTQIHILYIKNTVQTINDILIYIYIYTYDIMIYIYDIMIYIYDTMRYIHMI